MVESNAFYLPEVVEEMKGIVCYHIAEKIHSVSICGAFCYLRNKNWTHMNESFVCHCYECALMKRFKRILISKEDQQYLLNILNINNYDMYDDLEILKRLVMLNDD